MDSYSYIINKFNPVDVNTNPIVLDCNRDALPILFRELGYKIGVELGVHRGAYSQSLCECAPADGRVYSIDPWIAYKGYNDFRSRKGLDGAYATASDLLSKYPQSVIIKKFGKDAVKDFEDESIDYIYIDANHSFKSVLEDLEMWVPKIMVGGAVSGHDYNVQSPIHGVGEAVDTYVSKHGIAPIFVTFELISSFLWIKK